MTTIFLGTGFISAFTFTSLTGMLLVRKYYGREIIEKNHEVATVFIGILGTIYSVLLAFAVFVVWTQFGDAQVAVSREASQLSNMMEMSGSLPANFQKDLKVGIRSYCQKAISLEWPAMQSGKSSVEVDKALSAIWASIMAFHPQNSDQALLKDKLIDQAKELGESRSIRLYKSHEELPYMIWIVLWVGALITVFFCYFFGVRNLKAQILMTGGLAAVIALMLFTIWAINKPFTGDVCVGPEPLQFVLDQFQLK